MVKIKDLGNGNYQTFPITDDMIEVEDLDAWVEEHTPKKSELEIATQEARERIDYLERQLYQTDYKAIKFAEGELTEEEYASVREQRRAWRTEINELQEKYGLE